MFIYFCLLEHYYYFVITIIITTTITIIIIIYSPTSLVVDWYHILSTITDKTSRSLVDIYTRTKLARQKDSHLEANITVKVKLDGVGGGSAKGIKRKSSAACPAKPESGHTRDSIT